MSSKAKWKTVMLASNPPQTVPRRTSRRERSYRDRGEFVYAPKDRADHLKGCEYMD
jgi:hypothetical protein